MQCSMTWYTAWHGMASYGIAWHSGQAASAASGPHPDTAQLLKSLHEDLPNTSIARFLGNPQVPAETGDMTKERTNP